MLKVGMLSFAHVHSNGYARHVVEHPEAEITAIWDDQEVRGKDAAEKYGVPYVSDLDAFLSRDDVEAVVCDAETSKHKDVLIAAAEAGKHIYTEKALTVTEPDARAVRDAVKAADIKFMISLPSRTRKNTLYMKKLLDEGLIGKVTMMRSRVAHRAALDDWFDNPASAWFGDKELAGGGALFDLGCHTVDVMRWFMGEPESVVAMAENFSGTYDIDDMTIALVKFKSGALGILDTTWVHRAGPNPTEIYGTAGYVGSTRDGVQVINEEMMKAGINSPVTPDQISDDILHPMDQWIAAILHGGEMTITIDDGYNLTQLMDGIYKAAESGKEYKF